MRLVIQRVLQAEVQVNENTVGKINKGLLVFVGAGHEDSREVADKYLKKLLGLRIFEDENGKTNLRCMQTARRETDQVLLKQVNHIWRRNYMNI